VLTLIFFIFPIFWHSYDNDIFSFCYDLEVVVYFFTQPVLFFSSWHWYLGFILFSLDFFYQRCWHWKVRKCYKFIKQKYLFLNFSKVLTFFFIFLTFWLSFDNYFFSFCCGGGYLLFNFVFFLEGTDVDY
jgi:hypothetical protein